MTDFYIKLIEKSGFEEALVRRSLDLATQIDIHTLSRLFFDENPCSLSDTGVLFLKEAFYPFGFYDELKKICLPIEEASLYVYILLLEKAYDSFLSAINNETIFFDTAKRIAESAREYFHDNGKYGLYDYHFLANHVRGSILRLGEFEYQYSVTKNKKSITLHVPNG